MSFKAFLQDREFIEYLQEQFASPVQAMSTHKTWSAKKDEILGFWQNLRGDIPILITPISDTKITGSHKTYGEDGIRITGTWEFISSILSRLKAILSYENPQTRLRLVFRSVDKSDITTGKQTFVFYINVETRPPRKRRIKTIKPIK
jgi:hypothetical protein